MASRALTPTLAICLAAALAAGIGLARPDDVTSGSAPTTVADAPSNGATGRYGERTGGPDEETSTAVTIENFGFSGQTVVAPGATVEVTNSDETQHTLTASDGSFDTGPIDGGSTVTFVAPTEPGTYEFFCVIHPSMTGSLVVQS